MHSVGKRDDSLQLASALPPPPRKWRVGRALIGGAVCGMLPLVMAAAEPSVVVTTQTEVDGARAERASPTVITNAANSGGAARRNGATAGLVPASGDADESAMEAPFVNSLGMEFVRVPGTKVRFCRWDTRVSDWEAFIQEAGDSEQWGLYALDEKEAGWAPREDLSWRNPGFRQTGRHPVVGVSWEDARRFCAWLSKKEGRSYRLPTDAEWSAAVGPQKYPWGDAFPPPEGSGNYCGREAKLKTSGAAELATIEGYDDGFPRTSPVGSFPANRLGLYDMGGNVWQWCEDKYKASMNSPDVLKKIRALKDEKSSDGIPCRVLRGASWRNSHEIGLRSASRVAFDPRSRYDHNGFRCALEIPASAPAPKLTPAVELARIAPPATPEVPIAPMPPKPPKPSAAEELEIKELRMVRKQLKERQGKVEATLNHLLEVYTKGVSEGAVSAYNEQVRQAWAERDQVAAELQDVEENLRAHGGKR